MLELTGKAMLSVMINETAGQMNITKLLDITTTKRSQTSFVVVLVMHNLAWYPKKPASSRETMARNTIISICVL